MDTHCCGPVSQLGVGPGALAPPARALLSHIALYAAQRGLEPPKVISACRTREEQIELIRRWESGDREGIAARPAHPDNSKHISDANGMCWAFDLGNSHAWLRAVGPVAARFPGARWGGTFIPADLPHFDMEVPMRLAAEIRLI
jgi:hypothetical protein